MEIPILLVIAVSIGIAGLLVWGRIDRQRRFDDYLIVMMEDGAITPNEAMEWRRTGSPPERLTQGALSPYGD